MVSVPSVVVHNGIEVRVPAGGPAVGLQHSNQNVARFQVVVHGSLYRGVTEIAPGDQVQVST